MRCLAFVIIMGVGALITIGSVAMCVIEAVVVFRNQMKAIPHVSFAIGMLLFGAEALLDFIAATSANGRVVVYCKEYSLVAKSFLPPIWLVFSLTYARGNYQTYLVRWRIAIISAFLLSILLMAGFPDKWLQSSTINSLPRLLASSHRIIEVYFMVTSIFILMNLESTFRASLGTMRWRIKFLILGLAQLFIFRLYTSSQAILYSGPVVFSYPTSISLFACNILVFRSLLRGNVFNVDIYPSQKVLYASFALLLAGLYLVTIGAFSNVMLYLGIGKDLAPYSFAIIVGLVGLGVFGASDRLRQNAKLLINRNFQRPLHDYRQIWAEFTDRTSSLVTEKELSRAVVDMISKTLDVLSATIWLHDSRSSRLVFSASTSLPEARARELEESQNDLGIQLQCLVQNPLPIEINSCKESWVPALQNWNKAFFRSGGKDVLIPLVAKGQLLGILTLSDRVNGLGFSLQDFDLLKCIADQTAGGLLNIQLSRKLVSGKQLEAFQTVSAFFVHDLKNTVSTLSLTLRNLPIHYDDPLFREDSLRAISNSVNHLNDLIGRLSSLKQEIKLKRGEAKLNELVEHCLQDMNATLHSNLEIKLGEDVRVQVDQEQFKKVITNLVLNAKEALEGPGTIRVETGRQNGWGTLSVIDTGKGMSTDFLNNSLFQPFQTTKKNGTGIGMFQSKLIIEAHKGKIEVESKLKQGSTFRVLLPIST